MWLLGEVEKMGEWVMWAILMKCGGVCEADLILWMVFVMHGN